MKKKSYQLQSFPLKRFLWALPVLVFLSSLAAGPASAGDLGIKQIRVPKSVRDCGKRIKVVFKVKNYGSEDVYGKVWLTGVGSYYLGFMPFSSSRGGTKTLERVIQPPPGPENITWEAKVVMADMKGNLTPDDDEKPSNNTKSAATNFLCVR
jgi:hypothetical protein